MVNSWLFSRLYIISTKVFLIYFFLNFKGYCKKNNNFYTSDIGEMRFEPNTLDIRINTLNYLCYKLLHDVAILNISRTIELISPKYSSLIIWVFLHWPTKISYESLNMWNWVQSGGKKTIANVICYRNSNVYLKKCRHE